MKAVHFGAGNIGRGFVGRLLVESGYDVVFVDVVPGLVDALRRAGHYTVTETGRSGRRVVVDGFEAIDAVVHPDRVVAEIANADVVTTAVGVQNLPAIAPLLAHGLQRRVDLDLDAQFPPLAVFACENAIDATSLLEVEVRIALPEAEADALASVARFANAAIDRIVPTQPADAGLDILLEPYFEWVIDRTPFDGDEPYIVGVHWVDDLAPYIERKLFTVNAAHAAAAYHGFVAGIRSMTDAMVAPHGRAEVEAVIAETRVLLVARHGLDPDELQRYGEQIVERLSNPDLHDTVARVARGPLRKLGRHDRFVGPAADLAERGLPRQALLRAVAAALRFDLPGDPESGQLQALLATETASAAVFLVTGIPTGHPLHADLLAVFEARAAEVR